MTTLQRLLDNTHPAINHDPQQQPSLHITSASAAVIVIRDGVMQAPNLSPVQLASYTIASLASTLTSAGYTAVAVINGSLSALALLDGTYSVSAGGSVTVPIFTTVLWQIMQTLAVEFKRLAQDDTQSSFQATPSMASGGWLDYLGEFYEVIREPGEPDELYAVRMFDFSLGIRINNISIQRVLNDLGYKSTVDDTTPGPAFTVTVTLPTSTPSGFVYSTASLSNLVKVLRAAGVGSTIVLQGTLAETVHVTESVSSVTNQAAWKVGDSITIGQFTV